MVLLGFLCLSSRDADCQTSAACRALRRTRVWSRGLLLTLLFFPRSERLRPVLPHLPSPSCRAARSSPWSPFDRCRAQPSCRPTACPDSTTWPLPLAPMITTFYLWKDLGSARTQPSSAFDSLPRNWPAETLQNLVQDPGPQTPT